MGVTVDCCLNDETVAAVVEVVVEAGDPVVVVEAGDPVVVVEAGGALVTLDVVNVVVVAELTEAPALITTSPRQHSDH